jgi:hypothetical protein
MLRLVLVALLAALVTPIKAETWPNRPLTMVVPFATGGPMDVVARILQSALSDALQEQVVVENAGGGGGMIGAARVAKSAPDGYQFVLGNVGTHAVSQTLYKTPFYNSTVDFAPVVLVCGRLRVGKSFLHVLQHWSVQPCVRPVDAVHVTAGHNVLRGSGPDQTPAFDNASTQVGCPDRQIDRLCITCCSPSQPSSRRLSARSRLSRNRDGFLVSLAPSHHGPDHSRDFIGQRYCGNLRRPPRQQGREPGPMFGAMDLGVTDDRKRAGHKQAAQIAVTLFAYIAEPVLASARVLFRHDTNPGREVAP